MGAFLMRGGRRARGSRRRWRLPVLLLTLGFSAAGFAHPISMAGSGEGTPASRIPDKIRSVAGGGAFAFSASVTSSVSALAPGVTVAVSNSNGICDRTPAVYRAILDRLGDVDDCADVTAGHLARVTNLDLNHQGRLGLEELQERDFAGLVSLQILDLSGNDFRFSLPAGIFAGLASLRYIDLRDSSLASLPAGIFSGLPLETLNLHGNYLEQLSSGLFEGQSSLRFLDLSSNALRALPTELFDGLSSLRFLDLSYNAFGTLPAGLFDGLSSLLALDLGHASIASLPSGIFRDLTFLVGIDLHHNAIASLPPRIFEGLPLALLLLSSNLFRELPEGIFAGLSGDGISEGLDFDFNPSYAPRPHPFTVTLEQARDVRGVVVRVFEGVPHATRLTLTVGGTREEIVMPVGSDRVTHPVSAPVGTTITLEAGQVGEPAHYAGAPPVYEGLSLRGFPSREVLFRSRVSVRALSASVAEGEAARFRVEVEATDVSPTALRVEVVLSGGERFGVEPGARTVVIEPGATSTVLSVPTGGNGWDDADGVLEARVGTGAGYLAVRPEVAHMTITDDDDSSAGRLSVTAVEGLTPPAATSTDPRFLADEGTRVTLSAEATGVDQTIGWRWSQSPADAVQVLDGVAIDTAMLTVALPHRWEDFELTFTLTATATGYGAGSRIVEVAVSNLNGICDRTPTVQAAIVRKLRNISDCAEVSPAHLAQITGALDLSGADPGELQAYDFASLGLLEELHLRDNALVSLPEGLFDDLSSLWYLDLDGNDLVSLPGESFQGLNSLTALRLGGNALSSLPAGLFDSTPDLGQVYLNRNLIASLLPGLFDGLEFLRQVDLSGNAFRSLPSGLFDGLKSLEELWLSGNLLVSLPPGLFDGLTSLELLSLDNNALPSLPPGLFDGLESLEHLDLRDNELAFLPPAIFRGLPLTTLRLDANRFPALPPGIFTGLARGLSPALSVDGPTSLTFHENPKDAPRLHPFTVRLEAAAEVRAVVVRIVEGVPSPTRLTLTIAGEPRAIDLPIGADRIVYPAPVPAGTTITLEAGAVGTAAFVNAVRGLDLNVPSQAVVPADGDGLRVSIAALTALAPEGGEATFALSASAAATTTLPVTVRLSGDTTEMTIQVVEMDADTTTAVLTVATAEVSGGHGAVTATVERGEGYVVGVPSAAAVTVSDAGPASPGIEVSITASADWVPEGGEVVFTLETDEAPTAPLIVMMEVAGDVSPGEEGPRPVEIGAGSIMATSSVAVREDNGLYVGHGAMTATVRDGTGYRAGVRASAVVTVLEDEKAPTRVLLSVSPAVVEEHRATTTVTVMARLNGGGLPEAAQVTVALSVAGPSGVATVHPERLVLLLPAGVATTTGRFTVALPADDGAFGGDGTVTVSGTHPSLPVSPATVFVRGAFEAQVMVSGGEGLTALADSSFAAVEGRSVTLAATSTGMLGAVIYAWSQVPGDPVWVLAPEATTGRAELTVALPERSAPYTVRFRVTATHDPGVARLVREFTRTVTIEVAADDADPVIGQAVARVEGASGAHTVQVLGGVEVTLEGSASDVDLDQRLTLRWSGPEDVLLRVADPDRPRTVALIAPDEVDRYTFTFSADDDGAGVGDPAVTSEVVVEVLAGVSIRAVSLSGPGAEEEFAPRTDASGEMRFTFDEGASVRLVASVSGASPATGLRWSQSRKDVVRALDGAALDGDTLTIDLPHWWEDHEIALTLTVDIAGVGRMVRILRVMVRNRNGICDRTPAVYARIVGQLQYIDDCAHVTSTELSSLYGTLDLSDSGLVALQPYDFAGLAFLRTLNLADNRLESLPAGVFEGLGGLDTLTLTGNALTSLPPGLFAGLSGLTTLRLNHNRLASLPSGLFDGLRDLWILEIGNNALASLPAGLFGGLRGLARLTLHHNAFESLPVGSFRGLASLTALELHDNSLSFLPAGILDGLPLIYLNLKENRLRGLPEGLFRGLGGNGLRHFDFTRNPENTDRLHPVTVTLEAMEDARGVVVRIAEGAPDTTLLTLEVDGGQREVVVLVGDNHVTHPVPGPAGTRVTLMAGRVSYPSGSGAGNQGRGVIPTFPEQTLVLGEGIRVSIAALSASVPEGDEATFVLTASEAPEATLTVPVLLSGATMDSATTTWEMEIAAGTTGARRTVVTGEVSGGNGTVTAMVRGGAGYEVGLPSVAVVTVTDAHIGVTDLRVSIAASVEATPEGSEVVFTLTASEAPPEALMVAVEVAGEGAAAGERGRREVRLGNGGRESTFTVSARADDGLSLGNAAMVATVRGGADYVAGAPPSAGVTVWEDEKIPSRIRLSVSPAMLDEDAGATPVTVTARLNGGALPEAVGVPVMLSVSGRPGMTTQPAERFTITIPAGETAGEGMFTVTPAPDADAWGGDGRVTVSGAHSSFAVSGATVLVRDTFEAQVSVRGDEGLARQPDSSSGAVRFAAAEDTSVRLSATSPELLPEVAPVFSWSQASGDQVRVLGAEVATDRAMLRFPLPPRSAPYTVRLNVTARHAPDDVARARAFTREVIVEVAASDTDPVIEQVETEVEGVSGGDDVAVTPGTEVILRGSAVEADPEQHLTLGWAGPPEVRLFPVDAGLPGSVRFAAPAAAGRYTFTFSADDDGALFDPPVTREVVARVVSGPGVSIRALLSSVVEGGSARFEVRVSEAPSAALTVNIDLSGAEGFGVESSSRVVLGPDARPAFFRVPIEEDEREGVDGVLRVELRAGTGYTVVAPAFAEVAIRDIGDPSPDMNLDGGIDSEDALILYYSWALRGEIGTGR